MTGCKYICRYFLMIQGQNCFRVRIFQIADLSWRIKRDVIFFLILLLEDCIFLFHFVGDYKTELRRKDMNVKWKWFSISFDFVICNFLLHILNVANLKKKMLLTRNCGDHIKGNWNPLTFGFHLVYISDIELHIKWRQLKTTIWFFIPLISWFSCVSNGFL